MNRREWTMAVLRLLAIWWIAQLLVAVPSLPASWMPSSIPRPLNGMQLVGLGLVITRAATPLVMAVLAWSLGSRLASIIWGASSEARRGAAIAPGGLQAGLVSIAGLILIGLALPVWVRDLVAFVLQTWEHSIPLGSMGHPGGWAIGHGLQLAFGLWLFFGSGFFAGLVPRRWYLGQGRKDG